MSQPVESQREPQPATAATEQPQEAPEIDVQKLAEKVYQLMLADIRLEQARGRTLPRHRKR
jgi:hypothetical protein